MATSEALVWSRVKSSPDSHNPHTHTHKKIPHCDCGTLTHLFLALPETHGFPFYFFHTPPPQKKTPIKLEGLVLSSLFFVLFGPLHPSFVFFSCPQQFVIDPSVLQFFQGSGQRRCCLSFTQSTQLQDSVKRGWMGHSSENKLREGTHSK